ncbi:MAG TPA: 50S ribosome-binding protein YggL [Gemmatimonadaceae bacterium]|nr:50S ribosome-binding protein YggL [Gemmatimonadaceae bacterium]
MSAPGIGFEVTTSYVRHLSQAAKDGFRETFALFLESRGLAHGGTELPQLYLTVYGRTREVTEDDRAAVAEWLRGRLEVGGSEVAPLRDLREDR